MPFTEVFAAGVPEERMSLVYEMSVAAVIKGGRPSDTHGDRSTSRLGLEDTSAWLIGGQPINHAEVPRERVRVSVSAGSLIEQRNAGMIRRTTAGSPASMANSIGATNSQLSGSRSSTSSRAQGPRSAGSVPRYHLATRVFTRRKIAVFAYKTIDQGGAAMSVLTAKRHGPTHPRKWLPNRFLHLSTSSLHQLTLSHHHLSNDAEVPRGVVAVSVPPSIDVKIPALIDLEVAAVPKVSAPREVVLNTAAAVPLRSSHSMTAAPHAVAMAARRRFSASPPYYYPPPELDSLLDYSRMEREMHRL